MRKQSLRIIIRTSGMQIKNSGVIQLNNLSAAIINEKEKI